MHDLAGNGIRHAKLEQKCGRHRKTLRLGLLNLETQVRH
jgi:hypothetical protein